MDQLVSLATALPKLKTKIQLVGFLVLIGAVIAVRSVAPDQVHAQISAGAIGCAIVVFGLVLGSIASFPERERTSLVVILFLSFLIFVVALVILTGHFLRQTPKPEPGPGPGPVPVPVLQDERKRALLVSDLSEANLAAGRKYAFFDDWGKPPTISTLEVSDASVSFRHPDGRKVSMSIDSAQLPNPSNYSDGVVTAAGLTADQASAVARFFSAYGQFRASLARLQSVSSTASSGAFVDAVSASRETTMRGHKALCELGVTPPALFPPGGYTGMVPQSCAY